MSEKTLASLDTIYRWYKEFEYETNSVQYQKGAGRLPKAANDKNIAAVKKKQLKSAIKPLMR